jgi:prepilin-type N-terminal cleavage/methylation domain-containing protein
MVYSEMRVGAPVDSWPYNPNGSCGTKQGFSLIEIVCALLVVAILVASAGLPLKHWLDGMRVRSGLNRIAAEIYRARSLGVESGSGSILVIESEADGCAKTLRIRPSTAPSPSVRATLDLTGVCIRHSGDSVLVFNSRGMLKPPTRSFHASVGRDSDSVLISIAGRVRRSF